MTHLDPAIWQRIMDVLKEQHPNMCRQWFTDLKPSTLDGGLLKIRAGTSVQKNYLQNRCLEPFTEAAQQVLQQLVGVRFTDALDEDDAEGFTASFAVSASSASSTASADAPVFPASADPAAQSGGPGGPEGFNSDAAAAPHADPAATPRNAAARNAGSRIAAVTSLEELTQSARPNVNKDDIETEFGSPLILSPDFAFEQFVQGPNNDMAFAAAEAVADNPAQAYNPLFIHGGVGLGKTHLLKAVCQRILERDPLFRIVYVTCENFTNQFLDHVRLGDMKEFRSYYRDADMLVVDDIHFLADKERSQEEFFHTFNELHQCNKQIVLSSDAAPQDIPGITERLASRFNWGVVCKVGPPSYETRIAILKQKAQLRGRDVPDDVIEYLARKIDTNIRDLEGGLNNVLANADLRKAEISLTLARESQNDPNVEPPGRVTLQRIIDVVTEYYGVKVSELQSRRRHQSIAEPRQVCMFLARRKTTLSLEEIGGHFGGRDHTTVMHSVQKIEKKVGHEPQFEAQTEMLSQRVQSTLA